MRTPSPPLGQPWFDNTRRIKDLLTKLEIASVAALEQAEGWPTPTNDTGPPELHGPYWQWTAKVNGKTVNRRLTQREAELYQEWIDNDRRQRAIIAEMREAAATATELLLKEGERREH